MKVLFLGGSGNISSACVALALQRGYDVTLFNRGHRSTNLDAPVTLLTGDRNDVKRLQEVATANRYDVVCNFIAYTPEQIETDLHAFDGKVGQYIFISSASVYQKPPNHYLISESTPLYNPYWEYSRNKIACEERLIRAYRESAFPVTIVRPSYTFGPTWIPCGVGGHGYTVVDRIRKGKPVVSHGDGTSLWVMTFHTDFALGFVGLLGHTQAIGEAFHITSDEVLTWDQIYGVIGRAAGGDPTLVHIPSEFIAALYPQVGAGLLGDKAHSVVFDNSKIKRLVPEFRATVSFAQGIARSMAWLDAHPEAQTVDLPSDAMMDHLVSAYGQALAEARR